MKKQGILFSWMLLTTSVFAQLPSYLAKPLQIPLQYSVMKISDKITIDGRDTDRAWQQAKWTADFTDLETGLSTGVENRARCKMLWDDSCLYLFANIRENNLWATLAEHDSQVFQDNAFEMFICPSGSNFNYEEFQINAYETVWDLFLAKPYRNGGKGLTNWDIKGLKKAVHLNGTINNPNDRDSGWSIELAIPLNALLMNGEQLPKAGSIWRMNFSSVKWVLEVKDGRYQKQVDKVSHEVLQPTYSVWSPHGIFDLHYPERWGYVRFADQQTTESFLSAEDEKFKLLLWKYYYLQQLFKKTNKKYADTLDELRMLVQDSGIDKIGDEIIEMKSDGYQFWIKGRLAGNDQEWGIDNTGEFHTSKNPL